MRGNKPLAALVVAALWFATTGRVSAHRYDELLHATRVGIGTRSIQVEMSVTPGMAVADTITRDIDRDGDGIFSPKEQTDYAARTLAHITLRVDESRPLTLHVAGTHFPAPTAIRSGEAIITLQLQTELPELAGGEHRLMFVNNDTTAGSIFLANALQPNNEQITINKQRRDVEQRELAIDFTVEGASPIAYRWGWLGIAFVLFATSGLARRR